jgi:hypothetical protein
VSAGRKRRGRSLAVLAGWGAAMLCLGAGAAGAQNKSTKKSAAAKPAHVYTNDDFGPEPLRIDDPAAERRFEELNECNRDCFDKILTEAVRNFQYPPPRNEREKESMENTLLATLDDLRNDPRWQKLLRDSVATKYAFCAEWQKKNQAGADGPRDETPRSRADLAAGKKREAPVARAQGIYNAATGSLLDYRWSSNPGPMKAAVMVHQYLSVITERCAPAGDP